MLLQPVALQGEASDPKPLRLRGTCFGGRISRPSSYAAVLQSYGRSK